jgi:hypothetical protein
VQTTKGFNSVLNSRFNRTFITHVTTHKGCFAASGVNGVDNFVAINNIGDHDLRAFTGKQFGTNTAKTRRPSCNDGNFSL